jgi:hypothetical protein
VYVLFFESDSNECFVEIVGCRVFRDLDPFA